MNSKIDMVDENLFLITGRIQFPSNYQLKATIADIQPDSSVSLIYPSGHVKEHQTIVTGKTKPDGSFIINPDQSFTPAIDDTFILEARKRFGSTGNDILSLRTYLKWTGSAWQSITGNNIVLNTKTTALTLMDPLDARFGLEDTLEKVNASVDPSVFSGTVGNLPLSEAAQVTQFVTQLLNQNTDPTRSLAYTNGQFHIYRPLNPQKGILSQLKVCNQCQLDSEDLNGVDLSNGNLSQSSFKSSNFTGANLSNANLSQSNFEGANFSNADLTGVTFNQSTLTGTNFAGTTWVDGTTCDTDSIGACTRETNVNTYTASNQELSSSAINENGESVIIWASNGQDGDNYGIYGQRFDALGKKSGTEFRVNQTTSSEQTLPAVTYSDTGEFIVSWRSNNQDGDRTGIYARVFNPDATPKTNEFLVNQTTTHDQGQNDIAVDQNGNFVVTWTMRDGPTGTGVFDGVFGRQFDINGNALTNEFRLNETATERQWYSKIAMKNTGEFVATWQSRAQDGSSEGIYARRFHANGTPNGSEFLVNQTTTNSQERPEITINDSGDFVIVWTSQFQDKSGYGIYARMYNTNGTPKGNEFQVNEHTTFDQDFPVVKMDNSGRIVFVWQSLFQLPGILRTLYMRKYSPEGFPTSHEIKVNTFDSQISSSPDIAMNSKGQYIVSYTSFEHPGDTSMTAVLFKQYGY